MLIKDINTIINAETDDDITTKDVGTAILSLITTVILIIFAIICLFRGFFFTSEQQNSVVTQLTSVRKQAKTMGM